MGWAFSQEEKKEEDADSHPPEVQKTKQFERIKPCVIVGPSGVGKGTLLRRFREQNPGCAKVAVSHTSRKIREGEENGVHYHFVSKEEFEDLVKQGKFLEYANVHGNFYGTSLKAVEDVGESGAICFLEIDVQGAELIKKKTDAFYIFITCSGGLKTLEDRISDRGSETPETLKKRLETATEEFDFLASSPTFFDETIVNDDLDKACEELTALLKQWYPSVFARAATVSPM